MNTISEESNKFDQFLKINGLAEGKIGTYINEDNEIIMVMHMIYR